MYEKTIIYEMQAVIDEKAPTHDPAKDMKAVMSHLYNLAMKKEIISFNKTQLLDLPVSPTAKRERWEEAEVSAFWNDYPSNPFTGYILIMIYAGLRYGEISTQLLDNIHLDESYMVAGIKTEAGINREIPIADCILPIIKALAQGKRQRLLEMNEDNFYAEYWETISRLNLRHLPPQTCRHTYFSLMTAAGFQAGIITETGGHASYLTTMKNYVRLSIKEKLEAVNKISPNYTE
ncbi:MAG: tyrosine-type recombinase/integrase [Clostridia bacterium]|nr:tyrosine-type recombinase/integrase [Clostridia bacterium]MBQ4157985.1 tyrosine-type recombinase/integrase [Clostridia bacterium]